MAKWENECGALKDKPKQEKKGRNIYIDLLRYSDKKLAY